MGWGEFLSSLFLPEMFMAQSRDTRSPGFQAPVQANKGGALPNLALLLPPVLEPWQTHLSPAQTSPWAPTTCLSLCPSSCRRLVCPPPLSCSVLGPH